MTDESQTTTMPRWGSNGCKSISITGPVGKMMATPANGDNRSICFVCDNPHFCGSFICVACSSATVKLNGISYPIRQIFEAIENQLHPRREVSLYVCEPCGRKYGKTRRKQLAEWHSGFCGLCASLKPLTDIKDFGGRKDV